MRKLILVLVGCLLLALSQPATAGIYLKISDTGTFSLSNRPSDEAYQLIAGGQTREQLSKTDRAVEIAAGKHGLPESLIFAIISNSDGDDGGIMGLPPDVRSTMTDTEIKDVKKNVMAGTKRLSELLVDFEGNLQLTLGAFRIGKKKIEENDGLPDKQVRGWVRAVKNSFGKFEQTDEIIYTYKNENGVVTVVNIHPHIN